LVAGAQNPLFQAKGRAMRMISIADLCERFPAFRLALLRVQDIVVKDQRSAALDRAVNDAQENCRQQWGGSELSSIPAVAVWRTAYRGFGVKKTSYRSSVERLIKRVLAGDDLPRVNRLVDLYNYISLSHGLCLGADDLDKVAGDLSFRFSRTGDTFVDMSGEPGEDPNDPPKEGEVVYADSRHVLCRRWNWRQDARTIVTTQTTSAVLTVQSNGFGSVETAAQSLADGIAGECGGRSTIVILDRGRPIAEF
jgi:DNA/RNA-binding domain of Phe-tRNA-synthetase-like protein